VPGLRMPGDFPSADFDSLIAHAGRLDARLRLASGGQPVDAWRHFAAATNAFLYRWRAVAEADEQFQSLVVLGTPSIEERYREEDSLFAFFTNGLSALETICFAAYALAEQIDPSVFTQLARDPQVVTPRFVEQAFLNALSGDALTTTLAALLASPIYFTVKDRRNILSHRGSPGRHFQIGLSDSLGATSVPTQTQAAATPDWDGLRIEARLTQDLRAMLACGLGAFVSALNNFAGGRIAA
jgi:hypothetical protein